mmetsp:Transcript_41287/g.119423  ORF Transcript_41287/g.119423 Transcript_41287/m.119423 type:complete len:527 (-) Transcript_41287:120-1700(-)
MRLSKQSFRTSTSTTASTQATASFGMRDMVLAAGPGPTRNSSRPSGVRANVQKEGEPNPRMQRALSGVSQVSTATDPVQAYSSSRHSVVLCPALDFVDGHRFQTVVSTMIGANVMVLITETDHPGWSVWPTVDIVFAVAFLLEIVLRITHRGVVGFFVKDAVWGVLDLAIVVLGVFDSLVEPALQSRGIISRSGHSSALKFVRLFRLLRMLRFVKLFPKLMSFVQALLEMFSTMIWIFTFLTIIMVCLAIAMTHEIGRREAPDDLDTEHWQMMREYFQDVPTSLFTLFRVSTQDDWMTIAGPLVADHPAWSLFFVAFIVFVSWTMISVLTAVASESMVAATTDRMEGEKHAQDKKAKAFIDFLSEAFTKADTDGNGFLDKNEFETMMKKDFVAEQMQQMGFTMTEDEIMKAWDMLDVDRAGELTIGSFVNGLAYLQEKLTTRHVMNLHYLLRKVSRRLDMCIADISQQLEGLHEENEAIASCLLSSEASQEQGQLHTWLWYQWMRKRDPKAVRDVKPQRPAKRQDL